MKTARDYSVSRILQIMKEHQYNHPSELMADLIHYCDWATNDRDLSSCDIELVVDRAWSQFYNDVDLDEQLNFS
jgi:hypothetical protein